VETIRALLEQRLGAALAALGLPPEAEVPPAGDARFGDYQSNAAMVLAKQQRQNPRQLAQAIVEKLDVGDLCEKVEIAGAGFLNFRLAPRWISARFGALLHDARLGVPAPVQPRRFVIDFSSPNVAKPMHVGHIRSTFLGDSLARIARFVGHEVVRDNHIGDWGTQFGMLLLGWKTELDRAALAADPLGEMERIYKLISGRYKDDEATKERARAELVKLQGGDAENFGIWHEMIRLSQAQFDDVYTRLGVKFDVTLGESFYNDRLAGVVTELRAKGVARESEGAICVFSDQGGPPEKDPFLIKDEAGWRDNPALVLKKDGAANYTTTDLATLQYRLETWQPHEILYVTDGRQQLHFRQLFHIFARWQPETAARVKLAHVWFGAILGEDGRPFKTRSGETVKLTDLLEEAVERALKIVTDKSPEMPEADRREIARTIGLGAVKYADLSPNRQSDYTFSWDRMLSFNGNTAPYLQNAHVRIRSIFRKAETESILRVAGEPQLSEPAEFALAKKLLQFGEIVPQVLEDYRPNILATYLFELANTYHGFYESCPVLRSEEPARSARLALCEVTANVLRQGLLLLGIEAPERM
jgi:arginyl-tRNA synthetase